MNKLYFYYNFFLQFKLTVPKTGGVADLCEVLSQFVQVKPEFVSIIKRIKDSFPCVNVCPARV